MHAGVAGAAAAAHTPRGERRGGRGGARGGRGRAAAAGGVPRRARKQGGLIDEFWMQPPDCKKKIVCLSENFLWQSLSFLGVE